MIYYLYLTPHNPFADSHPDTGPREFPAPAEKTGPGTRKYVLIRMKYNQLCRNRRKSSGGAEWI